MTGDRGRTERLPTAILDSEVEERIRGGELTFQDERAVEQGLVDPLGLLVNESVWILRKRWCRPQGGAGELSFG